MRTKTCCFIGHRNAVLNELELKKLEEIISELIVKNNVKTFLFGSRSKFDDACYDIISKLKTNFTELKRIYVRAEYQHINNNYKNFLLENYEDTFFDEKLSNAGRFSYIKRNELMINNSDYCIFYYNETYSPNIKKHRKNNLSFYQSNSGTSIAYSFAIKNKKFVINVLKSSDI